MWRQTEWPSRSDSSRTAPSGRLLGASGTWYGWRCCSPPLPPPRAHKNPCACSIGCRGTLRGRAMSSRSRSTGPSPARSNTPSIPRASSASSLPCPCVWSGATRRPFASCRSSRCNRDSGTRSRWTPRSTRSMAAVSPPRSDSPSPCGGRSWSAACPTWPLSMAHPSWIQPDGSGSPSAHPSPIQS